MLKKILMSLLLLSLTAYAGEFSDAISSEKNVFLYLYLNGCSYCNKFEPNYRKLVKSYSNNCEFVKINVETPEGADIAKTLQVQAVPYALIINKHNKKTGYVTTVCLLDYACINKKFTEFLK